MNCIFCKIIAGEIPSEILYRDDRMIVIRDIDPKADCHYLAIPIRHYARLEEMTPQDRADFGAIVGKIAELADQLGLNNGYRLVINQGEDAGQTVHHLHIHVMGGQVLDFPDMRTKA